MKHINPFKHTTAENYEHFLSYMYGAGARHNALLCQAYFDGSDAPHEEYEAYMAAHPEPVKQDTPYCKSVPMCAKPCGDESCVEPVKQEPVAWVSNESVQKLRECGWSDEAIATVVPTINLDVPVDAKAIREQALEEAAKWFETNGANTMIKSECAVAIRGLK